VAVTKLKGLCLLAYGLEGAGLLGFGASDVGLLGGMKNYSEPDPINSFQQPDLLCCGYGDLRWSTEQSEHGLACEWLVRVQLY
jgi:hypothetical protein